MAGKPKLHELIAVEQDLQGQYRKILEETGHVFKDKDKNFKGFERKVHMLSDAPEAKLEETSESFTLVTTVPLKLEWMQSHVIRYWDAVYQKERTNQEAKADLVIDGVTIGKDLPATYLLGMEDRLKAMRAVYEQIPTHEPGKIWLEDKNSALRGACIAKEEEKRIRTKKVKKAVVLYPATDQHPAQVKELDEDVPVGHVATQFWSGMVSPAEKADMLGRLDKLLRAVKKARMRANGTDVIKVTIGKAMTDYVNKGLLPGSPVAEESD